MKEVVAVNLPLVTVSIPVYNAENFIENCLNSVLAQTYPNIEILLVDDKGKDKSMEIVRRIKSENPDRNIQIIENEVNSGLSVVRNKGIDFAKGEYLFFIDSDDQITPNCIELMVKNALQTGATMVTAQNRWVNTFDHTIKDFGFPIQLPGNFCNDNNEILKQFSEGKIPVVAWNKLMKTDFLRKIKIRFFSGIFSQDELFSFELMLKLDSISALPQITYIYILREGSVIFTRKKKNFEDYQIIVEKISEFYKKENNPLRKKYILKHLVKLKELIMINQWKAMRTDSAY